MILSPLGLVVRHIHRMVRPSVEALTDQHLIDRFVGQRDESAFEMLLERRGPMVLGLCRILSERVADLVRIALRDVAVTRVSAFAAVVVVLGLAGMGVLCAPPAPPGEDPATREVRPGSDSEAEQLPEGALVRLGSLRFRHGHTVMNVAFSPDGKYVASAGHDHSVRLWDVTTGRQVRTFSVEAERDNPYSTSRWLYCLAFSADGKTLAVGEHAPPNWRVNTVRLWEVATGKELHRLRGGDDRGMVHVAFTPDGKQVWSSTFDGVARQWDVADGKELLSHDLNPTEVGRQTTHGMAFALSPDGKLLVSGHGSGGVSLRDPATAKTIRYLEGHEGEVFTVVFSQDGKRLASAGADKTVRIWDPATGKELRKIEREKPIRSVAFSPDRQTVAVGDGAVVVLLEADSGKEVRRLMGPNADVRSIAFSPDGKHVAAAAVGHNTFSLWETATGKSMDPQLGHQGGFVGNVSYTADGKTIASVGADGTLRLWESATGKELRRIAAGQTSNRAGGLSPDGKELVVGAYNGAVVIYETASGKELRRWPAHKGIVSAAVFSQDGKVIASGGPDLAVCLWDASTGKEVRRIENKSGGPATLSFSPDGALLACAVQAQPLQVFETATGNAVSLTPTEEEGAGRVTVDCATFSPDGRFLATGGRDGVARIWDMKTGKPIRELRGHAGWIMAIAYSPDGRNLAVGNWRNARLWEVATGKERGRFRGQEGDVAAVAFAPDGLTLAGAGSDTTGLVWDLTGGRLQRGKLREKELPEAELETTWLAFGGEDGAKAYAALWALAASPKGVLPLLRDAVPPVPRVEAKRIEKLIAQLDDSEFDVREKATQELEKVGEQALTVLQKVLDGKPSVEVRRRVEQVLEGLQKPDRAERVVQTRALEALEVMGTPEARQVLQKIAAGAPEARVTREVQATLKRLDRRSP